LIREVADVVWRQRLHLHHLVQVRIHEALDNVSTASATLMRLTPTRPSSRQAREP
jgi:hypothetical protein